MKLFKFIFISVFLLITFYLSPITIFAVDETSQGKEFASSYDVTYDVGLDGVTTVTEKVVLKNLTSQYYATQFSLTIGATQISDISASDPGGPLEVSKETKGTSTTLSVKFNQQIAGEGKELPWTLTFKSEDFASSQGKIWEVSVPKIVSSTNLESYNVTLSVPQSFGNPTSISPTPKKMTPSFDRLFLNFDKGQLTQSGVSANFGDSQLFDFDLNYHLENPGIVAALTNIALPPDTEYQDVIFSQIEPKPINVTMDSDGNYLAWYKLNRQQKLSVRVAGSAKLLINSKVKKPQLDPNLKERYLQANKYWDKDNPLVKTKLKEILDNKGAKTNQEKIKLIYQYVVNNLKYDSARLSNKGIDRLGAVTALNNPNSAVCMEFTDLFITLARSSGIPARELNGFAYTSNPLLRPLSLTQDILHAWPEYWDNDKGWVMVDPTWENTTGGVDYFNKFDLNHFVFAIKGLSSEQPIPAGSYKYIGQDSKDVKVTFSDKDFLGKPQLDVLIDSPNPILSGFPGKIKIKVSNLGNSLQQSSAIAIRAGKLNILNSMVERSGPIPSFGNGEYEFNIRTNLLESYDDIVEVKVAGQKFEKQVQIRPFIIFQSFPFVLIGLLGGMILIYFALLGGLIYRKRFLKAKKPTTKINN